MMPQNIRDAVAANVIRIHHYPKGAHRALKMTDDPLKSAAKGFLLLTWRLPWPIGNHVIIPCAQQAFPAADGEGKNALQFVVFRPVRPVH
jgi:hypothetical protein